MCGKQRDCTHVSLPENQAILARGLEQAIRAQQANDRARERIWRCALCSELGFGGHSQEVVRVHVRTKSVLPLSRIFTHLTLTRHDIEDPRDEDFIDMKGSQPISYRPAVLLTAAAQNATPPQIQQLVTSGIAAWCDLSVSN